MVISASYEIQTFLVSVILGVGIGTLYDIARGLKFTLKKTAFADAFMWISVIVFSGFLWFEYQNGEIRWYMVTGALLSALIYFLTISKYVLIVASFLLEKTYRFFHIIFKLLLTPPKFLCKILGVYVKWLNLKFLGKVKEENNEKKT